jgi:carbonic anhydrase
MNLKKIALLPLFIAPMTFASVELDWGYHDHHAPEHWAKLNSQYQACTGSNQSPINIANTVKAQLPALKFDYKTEAKSIVNNNHTLKVYFNSGNILHLDDQDFELKQFHLHSPSENTIQGKSYPMEMHLVHASAQGELTVVAVMFEEGQENAKLKQLWKRLPQQAGKAVELKQAELASVFLPQQLDYYRFNGSLTTPPCTEGVRWVVIKQIQQASKQQIQAFSQLLAHPNNRPIQAQNARLVLE